MNRSTYLIIGNSTAAVAAVEGIRSVDPERPITLISREPEHTYSRPLISYLLAGQVDEQQMFYRRPDFYSENRVEPLLGVEVTGLDPESRCVETSDGRRFGYEKLLIATGGTPILPGDVDGAGSEGVFTFTTWEDVRGIEAYMGEHAVRRVVVVGGGLIGLKAVEAFAELGLHVTVVELAERILAAGFGPTAGRLAARHLRRHGVAVRCETTVRRIETDGGAVSGVELRDGEHVECRLVIFAIGVLPNTQIAWGTRIHTDRGLLVDRGMRTNVEGVYAGGDVAQAPDLLGRGKRTIPILPNAYRQGWIAGCNMAGADSTYPGGLAMNSVEIFGLPTMSVGLTSPAAGDGCEVLKALDEEEPSYRKVVVRDGRVLGAVFIGKVDRAGIITGLIKQGVDVSEFKDVLVTDRFGLLSLPREYRKHVVSGAGIEV